MGTPAGRATTDSSLPPGAAVARARWRVWRQLSPTRKLAFAGGGIRRLASTLEQRGRWGRLAAIVMLPAALLYVVASVIWDTVVYRVRPAAPGRQLDRRVYVRRRFRGTQRLVHWREERLVAAALRLTGSLGRVLDIPAGYGRFVPALAAVADQLVGADLDRTRLLALPGRASATEVLGGVQANLHRGLPFATGTFDLVFTFRYFQHARSEEARLRVLEELSRVSRRFVLVSYYRGSNLHALVRMLQTATRGDRRHSPTMLRGREFDRLLAQVGYRRVSDVGLIPGFHAERIVLLERPALVRELEAPAVSTRPAA